MKIKALHSKLTGSVAYVRCKNSDLRLKKKFGFNGFHTTTLLSATFEAFKGIDGFKMFEEFYTSTSPSNTF